MTTLAEDALAVYRQEHAENEATAAQMAESEHAEQTAETLKQWGLVKWSEDVPDRIDGTSLWFGDVQLRREYSEWERGWVWTHVWPIEDADGPITRLVYGLFDLGLSLHELAEWQQRRVEAKAAAYKPDATLEPLPADALTRIADALERLCEIQSYMIPA